MEAAHRLACTCICLWFQGVEGAQLALDLDWLISELKVRQRDVGFTGKPEEVIQYASALLGENLVTR